MEPILKYYSYNEEPNEEELKACIDITSKSKCTVMLYYGDTEKASETKSIFIHPNDDIDKINHRINILRTDTVTYANLISSVFTMKSN